MHKSLYSMQVKLIFEAIHLVIMESITLQKCLGHYIKQIPHFTNTLHL